MLAWGPLEPGLAMVLTFVAICLTLPFGWRTIAHIWRVPRAGPPNEAQRSTWSRSSATMGLTTVINAAEAAMPLILVGALSTMEQAGIFRVATAMMVFTNLPSTMISVMVPAMASSLYQRQDMAQLARLSLAASLVMFFPTLAIAGCLWIFGDALLGLAFGNEYRAAWPILSVLAGASVVNAISGISISLLHASRHDAVVTKACGLSLAVTCIGLVAAAFDGRAAAFAMAVVAGMFARTVFLALSTYRYVGIDPTILAVVTRIIRHHRGEHS
jgi:O-antigen/teichoic acid export membrane protein